MQPAPAKTKLPQQRLRRFIRQPERLGNRQITEKGLDVIAAIERYRFLPSSLLVRLVDGGQRNNHRQLQTLFHKGLISRFALPKYGGPGEFIYFLDSAQSLSMLFDAGRLSPDQDSGRREEIVRYNRDRDYAGLHRDPAAQGKVLYIQHELMVSRFHALLELACKKASGKVVLEQWKQGPELWDRVEVPKVRKEPDRDEWSDVPGMASLPHRPDAFFTLYFPSNPDGRQRSHFLYEADRGTENTTRFKLKLRAHYHFIVKNNLQRTPGPYNVHTIRAVLVESTKSQWAHNLREAGKHPIVSPKPSPLFWFTTSEVFTKPTPAANGRTEPLFLSQPEVIFRRVWASPASDQLLNLAD